MADRMLVSTMLTMPERYRVDAVGSGAYDIVHRDSIDEVVSDVRACRAHVVVLSVARCHCADRIPLEGPITRIVRDFPRVATVALLSDAGADAPAAMLLLGRSGVRTVIDARRPEGWRVLREALSARFGTVAHIESVAVAQLTADLRDTPWDCRHLFVALFAERGPLATVQQLARTFALLPTTLISRFRRRALPSPRTYLAWARLVRVAALLENPGTSLSAAVTRLDYSSPQSFTRHLRLCLGLTVPSFRRGYGGAAMLDRFRGELILPHRERLRGFRPIDGSGPMRASLAVFAPPAVAEVARPHERQNR